MNLKALVWLLALSVLISCQNKQVRSKIIQIDADSLIERIGQYNGSKVKIEGIIVHVCGVDGMKMKLRTRSGAIIKIAPKDSAGRFNNYMLKKKVFIRGSAIESRIEKSYVDKCERSKTLLCHVDNTPCKDTAWVKMQIKSGKADSLSGRDIKRLRNRMAKKQKDYISVVTIVADGIDIDVSSN